MNRRSFWSLFILAAIYRVAWIWRAPLWYDENFTLILARLPFVRMIQATAGDVHPPLWYLIEWTMFHYAPQLPAWAIRIPALVFSLLAFVMFVRICRVLEVPVVVQLTASFLMAVLPMQIWYAQEGRMYAMLEFLVLAALYAGLTRKWFLFLIVSVALLYTQNYGIFYLAVISLVLIVIDWPSADFIISSGVMAGFLYMPWVMVIMRQMKDISGRYWIMDAGAGALIAAVYKQFWANAMLPPGVVTSYIVTFAALFIGLYALTFEKSRIRWIIVTMAFVPVAIAWLASVLWQPLLLFRPLIGISPFLYLIVSWPMDIINKRKFLYASCFIAPVMMFGVAGYYNGIADMKGEGVQVPLLNTLTYINSHWREGDVIYYTDDGPMVNLMPYTDLPQYRMPACGERVGWGPVLGSLSNDTRKAFGIQITELSDVPHKRAWVFAPRSPLHPLCYEAQIAEIAPVGQQLITVDDNEFIQSGLWLVEK